MNNWNLVSKNLPEDGKRVLVYTEHTMYGKEASRKRDIAIAEYHDGKWKCTSFLGNQILAWMPLPEAPEAL